MTGKQEIFIGVLNYLHTNKMKSNVENVNIAVTEIHQYLSISAKKWYNNATWRTIRKLAGEIDKNLEMGEILDETDFAPGGRRWRKPAI